MIKEIQFRNFKVLQKAELPLGRFTLIVGPNGSGKSTALNALSLAMNPQGYRREELATAGQNRYVAIRFVWDDDGEIESTEVRWEAQEAVKSIDHQRAGGQTIQNSGRSRAVNERLHRVVIYSLDPQRIAEPVPLVKRITLGETGFGLAGVLDGMRDQQPECFESLNAELKRWLPEFDRILFDVPQQGVRSFLLRTRSGFPLPAKDLSDGTLLALAILTLAYLPDPPTIVAFEDPDRGIHPRLLRDVQDALYRLAYPENYGESRPPVQVIATTHSPYFLDLFREHPEEIVIAQKNGSAATFDRLSDRADIEEILQDSSLGEVWYSGVLGGVPAEP
jgi:predicted ATPase